MQNACSWRRPVELSLARVEPADRASRWQPHRARRAMMAYVRTWSVTPFPALCLVGRGGRCPQHRRRLALRAYRNQDFPKGMVEPGEGPLDAATRETAEEAAISDLAFRWGEAYCETTPYGRGKVARYSLAETRQTSVSLPVLPVLKRAAEHDEWRWVSFIAAERLLPPRVQPILAWASARIEA